MFLVKEQPTFLAQPAISLPACGRADVEDCSCHHRQCDTRGDEYRRRSHASSFLKSFKSFNRKRLIISAICFLLLIFILYLCDLNTTGGKGVGAATNFLRRAVDTTSEDGHQNAFVRQKRSSKYPSQKSALLILSSFSISHRRLYWGLLLALGFYGVLFVVLPRSLR